MSLFPTLIIPTCLRRVDVSEFAQIVNHPTFQALRGRSQLSCVDKIFPGARHSRLEHSIFVFHFTTELLLGLYGLVEKGCISKLQARTLQIAALLHDIGHPPFSHAIEQVLGHLLNPQCPVTHHDRAKELIHGNKKDSKGETLAQAIEKCGVDVCRVEDIILKADLFRSDKQSSLISHNTLGTDKLSYILVDSYHSGYLHQLPLILDMFPWYCFSPLGVSEKIRDMVMCIQQIIQDMYEHVYYDRCVVQYARMLQKATELQITSVSQRAGVNNVDASEAWKISEDSALLYELGASHHPIVSDLAERYADHRLFYPILELKHPAHLTKAEGRCLQAEVEPKTIEYIVQRYGNPLNLTLLENAIEAHFNLPRGNILTVLSGNPKRLIPEDVPLFDANGQKIDTLFERYPDHYKSLIERANSFFGLIIYGTQKAVQVLGGQLNPPEEFGTAFNLPPKHEELKAFVLENISKPL